MILVPTQAHYCIIRKLKNNQAYIPYISVSLNYLI